MLFAAFVLNVVSLSAAEPVYHHYLLNLVKNQTQYGSWKTKDTWTRQEYAMLSADTPLTSPCPKCKLAVRAQLRYPDIPGQDLGVTSVLVTGQTGIISNPSSFATPAQYRLHFWRFDTTLLNTHTTGRWKLN